MNIVFNAVHRTLAEDERLRPRPASKELPSWKSEVPVRVSKGGRKGKSLRACPALDDYLHLGYIIPLWADLKLTRVNVNQNGQMYADPNGKRVHCETGIGVPSIQFHLLEQVKGAEPLEPPFGIEQIVKPTCPWLVETPPNWSVLVLPLSLHEKQKKLPLEPIPGVINTDHWHQLNTPCRWDNIEPVMELKAGTPFMHVIPFCRSEPLEADISFVKDETQWKNLYGFQSDFEGSYRRQQKNAEKSRGEAEE